jgi:hypothetical protein
MLWLRSGGPWCSAGRATAMFCTMVIRDEFATAERTTLRKRMSVHDCNENSRQDNPDRISGRCMHESGENVSSATCMPLL